MSISGSSIREILHLVNDTDGFLMRSMDWYSHETDTASTQESSEGQGTPDSWSKWGGGGVPTIRLYPNPDAVYTIGAYVALTPANMTADADTPMIPLAWRHRVLVPYAAALLLEQDGNSDAWSGYDRLMARYERNYEMMRIALGTGKRGTFNAVAPDAFDHLPHSGGDWFVQ